MGTAYDYQRWTKIGCCRLGSQSRCKGVQGLGPLRLPLPREKQAAFDGHLFCHDYFSSTSSYGRCMWVPVQAFISWYYSLR